MMRFPTSSARLVPAAALLALAVACDGDVPDAEPPADLAPAATTAVEPMAAQGEMAEGEMSEHCKMKAQESPFERTEVAYAIPDVTLTDQAGQPFPIQDLASSDRPVALNFIFATCTTICPVMTATFAQMRRDLGDDADRVKMVSVTIDPQHDTPEVLAEYAAKYDAPSDWTFLTGDDQVINDVLRSFDAEFGSKFNHHPVTVLHAPGESGWIRLDGLGSGAALASEVRTLLSAPTTL